MSTDQDAPTTVETLDAPAPVVKKAERRNADETTAVAKAIIDAGAAERIRKTEKLKILRLAKEAADNPPVAKAKKKSKAKSAAE